MMTEKAEAERQRYLRAAHAMQTGVAYSMETEDGRGEVSPKHLRVGVNAAMVEHSAVVLLLIAKGVIDEEEYYKALADKMEEEAKSYADRLSRSTGGASIRLI